MSVTPSSPNPSESKLIELPTSEPEPAEYVIVSVDVETTSTKLLNGDVLSIGAATLWPNNFDRMETFYINLKPLTGKSDLDTIAWWQGFSERFKETQENQVPVPEAMQKFADWVNNLGSDPVFMAWPAHFDFGWIDHYFNVVGIANPFSYKPLDQVSYIAGLLKKPNAVKGSRSRGTLVVPESWEEEAVAQHNALSDAIAQRNGFVQTLKDTK